MCSQLSKRIYCISARKCSKKVRREGNKRRTHWYVVSLRWTSAAWNRSKVEGLRRIAARALRRAVRNSDQKPNPSRPRADSRGVRCRVRQATSNCCFSSKFSAITALAPPGFIRRAIVTRSCAIKMKNFLMSRSVGEMSAEIKFCQSPEFLCEFRIRQRHV